MPQGCLASPTTFSRQLLSLLVLMYYLPRRHPPDAEDDTKGGQGLQVKNKTVDLLRVTSYTLYVWLSTNRYMRMIEL